MKKEKFHSHRYSSVSPLILIGLVIIAAGLLFPVSSCLGKNPVYRSSAIIEINQPSPEQLASSEGLIPDQKPWDIEKAIQIGKSRSIAELIMEQVYLLENLNKKMDEKERRILIDKIREGIEINISSPGIIEFSAIYDNPVICQKIVNRLIRFFIKERLRYRDKVTEDNIEWVVRELEFYRKKLLDSEEVIDSFRKGNRNIILDIESAYYPDSAGPTPSSGIIAKRYEAYSQDLLDFGIETNSLKAEEKLLVKELSKTKERIVTEETTDQKTGKVISKTEAVNPVYQELQIDLIRCRRKISGIEEKIKLIKVTVKATEVGLEKLPKKEREYAALMRKYNNYVNILAKLERVKEKVFLMRRLEMEDRGTYFRILEAAEVPREPYIPE